MKNNESTFSKIVSWIIFIVLLFAIYKLFGIFKDNFFNGFVKGESTLGITKFSRDKEIKYLNGGNSYKMYSPELNNAAFYKEVEVTPNTTYKVTCFVKTEDVVPEQYNSDGGANICIIEAPEISKSITGTNDWQKIEMMFNSQGRTKVMIGFRLGGNTGRAKGTAWFSDFKLERGITDDDNTWKVGCFVFKKTDVNIDGVEYKYSISMSDMQDIKTNMQRFKSSCQELSKNKMKVQYTIHEIEEPITTVSYSDEHGYYVDPYDVNKLIEDIVLENEYDYIFATVRMSDEGSKIPVKDWIGLRKYGFIRNRIFKY